MFNNPNPTTPVTDPTVIAKEERKAREYEDLLSEGLNPCVICGESAPEDEVTCSGECALRAAEMVDRMFEREVLS